MNIPAGKYMKITVADDGSGIDPAVIDNIFDPFFSTKDITEGTGLGLSVVHGIVKGHRGGIRVESKVMEGTRFEIYLPQGDVTHFVETEAVEADHTAGLSILFVEDDEDQLNSVPRILVSLGHTVVAVADPQKAIDMVIKEKMFFDLLVSDYDMPTMRGTRLAETLPDLRCIIVSGRNDAIAASMPHQNIRKVLIKPYDKDDLKMALNVVFQKE
jgi:CheY-like chemotaxis protein